MPKTPKLKISLGPDVHTVIANGATIRLGVDYTHTSEIYNDVEDDPLLRRPPEDLFNASAGIIAPNGKITFTVGGTNLTDRRFITTGQYNAAGGTVYGSYNAPREGYATLSANH